MPKYAIQCIESFEDKPGLQMVAYSVEAETAEQAFEKFGQGEAEVFMESAPGEAVVIGVELLGTDV